MPDNVPITAGSGTTIATDDVGGVQYQRVKVSVGADGSATDATLTNPLPVGLSDGAAATTFGPITSANTILFAALDTAHKSAVLLRLSGLWSGAILLQASDDGTSNWWDAPGLSQSHEIAGATNLIAAPDLVLVPVTARFFRAITSPDFVGSVSGSVLLRNVTMPPTMQRSVLFDVDPQVSLPVAGADPTGYPKRLAVTSAGQMVPADGLVLTGTRSGAQAGTVLQFETTGYGAVAVQVLGTWTGTITFQTSNDATTWSAVAGWLPAGGAAPVTTTTANGQWVFPCTGRFSRVQITTAGTGFVAAAAVLKNFSAWMPLSSPTIAANSAVNVAQLAGTAPVNAGVAGTLAIGGNIAVGAAPTTNPISLAWDGTNTRRILTDASSGGVVLGSSTVTNGQTLARFAQTVTTPAATQIKASAGRLTMLNVSNGATVAGFLHLYNAAAVTLGTTSDVHVYAVPAAVDNFPITLPDGGLYFSTGIGAAFTAGVAATDNTAFGSAPTLVANYAFI